MAQRRASLSPPSSLTYEGVIKRGGNTISDSPETIHPGDHSSVKQHNREAWDHSVKEKNRWTVCVGPDDIAQARGGDLNIVLTPTKLIPKSWLGDVRGRNILGLASGGGQQGPLLAAAGANVTIVDLSPMQLEQDQKVADREGLSLELVNSSSDDLSMLADHTFDLIINPCSSCFFPDLAVVWKECRRVLKPGGSLLTGFVKPISFCFDFEKANVGEFHLKYPLPFSDISSFSPEEKKRFLRKESPVEFSHTLTAQMGGLLDQGFVISGFYEDDWGGSEPIDRFFPSFASIKADLPN